MTKHIFKECEQSVASVWNK